MKSKGQKRPLDSEGLTDFTVKLPMWIPDQIIRNRNSGRALIVIHVYRNATLVADLQDKSELVQPMMLLEREYHYYARDTDMKNKDEVNYEKDWVYHPVQMI